MEEIMSTRVGWVDFQQRPSDLTVARAMGGCTEFAEEGC